MKCVICKVGKTKKGLATLTLERGDTMLVFKKVTADICENCGEEYIDAKITARLLETAEEAAREGVEIEVREYVKVA